MKLIKLTNASASRVGESLILNTDLILSFFEHTQEDGTKVTGAAGVNSNTWEVTESIDSIMAQLKE
jgi:hypothetical protein